MNRGPVRQSAVLAVAATAHRLAVLITAGVSPHSAWAQLDAEASPEAAGVAAQIEDGTTVSRAILAAVSVGEQHEADAWRSLAAAWQVATAAGTSLAPSLRSMASTLRALADAQRAVQITLAGPVATARLVMVLPAVALVFGILLGFDPLRALLTTPVGLGCCGCGVALIVAAARWNRHLVELAQPVDVNPGLIHDLTAIAVAGGASMSKSRESVAIALADCHITIPEQDVAAVERIIALSLRVGVPAAELLRAEAEELRRLARARASQQAEVLAVRLMLPLGLCILPAFMVLGIAPLVLSLLSSTFSGV